MIRRVWFWEQAVLVLLLGWAVVSQLAEHRAPGVRGAVLIVVSAALVLAAQKVRSMSDRQREANEAAGVGNAPMSCAGRVAGWAAVLQALSLFVGIATSPTAAHVAIAVYVAAYPLWRRAYRRRRPIVLYRDEGSIFVRSKLMPLPDREDVR